MVIYRYNTSSQSVMSSLSIPYMRSINGYEFKFYFAEAILNISRAASASMPTVNPYMVSTTSSAKRYQPQFNRFVLVLSKLSFYNFVEILRLPLDQNQDSELGT